MVGSSTVTGSTGVTIEVVDGEVNDAWERSSRGTSITVRRTPLITRQSQVMALGSCFAVEIRAVLRREGFEVLPGYFDLRIDLDHERVGRLPEQGQRQPLRHVQHPPRVRAGVRRAGRRQQRRLLAHRVAGGP